MDVLLAAAEPNCMLLSSSNWIAVPLVPVNVTIPDTFALSNSVCPSTSKSPFASIAPVNVETPVTANPVVVVTPITLIPEEAVSNFLYPGA